MLINGHTEVIAHIGFPTHAFKAPMIYNPYFEKQGINALVVPMGCQAEDYPVFLRAIFKLSNIRGALITMPHKVTTLSLVDEVLPAAAIAGACNAVRLGSQGQLQGDMFDGEGFVRGVLRKGFKLQGARVLVVGAGGVGSAIAASLAAAGVAAISLFDMNPAAAEALAGRLRAHYPALEVATGSNDPAGHDLVVNATPMGMNEGDPLPMDVSRIAPGTFVGEVVMRYLEYFNLPSTTPDALRAVARLQY
jgi:shikimate dehydrogenase